jgi:hypothetical protein
LAREINVEQAVPNKEARSFAEYEAADIFSAGVVLHELLFGKAPFSWDQLNLHKMPGECLKLDQAVYKSQFHAKAHEVLTTMLQFEWRSRMPIWRCPSSERGELFKVNTKLP